MSAKTAEDLRGMSDDQISKRLKELAKEKMNLRFQKGSGQLENTSAIRQARKETARLKTIQSERKNEQTVQSAPKAEKKTTKTKEKKATKAKK